MVGFAFAERLTDFRERERESALVGGAEGEKQADCTLSGDPGVGSSLLTPRSRAVRKSRVRRPTDEPPGRPLFKVLAIMRPLRSWRKRP